jgi:biopolymer transport protein ExbD
MLMNAPNVNVTPLIDVLLVLLIIFMVVAPLKPSSFKACVPREPRDDGEVQAHPNALVASIENDGSLRLNTESDLGTVDDPARLIKRLRDVFDQRIANGDISESFADDSERPASDRVERTVFIKAPRSTGYGEVAKLVDAVKSAGAYPISLQIDDLH